MSRSNLLASTLFLFAVGLIYAIVGTLNMADLAVKAPLVSPSDAALLRTGVLLLFLVFAIKAALVPLHWWLPATYAAASAPAAALFMIMTKVGVYAMLRVYGTVFGAAAGPLAGIAEPWILPAALATVVIGAIGILASRTLLDLVAFAVVGSMGMLLIAIGVLAACGRRRPTALYYLVHSTLCRRGAVSGCRSDRRAARAHSGPARAGCRDRATRTCSAGCSCSGRWRSSACRRSPGSSAS